MPFAAVRDPRFIQGRALLKAKKYEAAIDCFCDLLEALVSTFGDQHVETCPVLFEYGSVLLLKAESSANLFGDSVEDAGAEQQGTSVESSSSSSSSGSSSSEQGMSGIEKAKRAAAAANAAAADLEIAWEVLEVSRVILSKHLDDPKLATDAKTLLARVHLRLGDHELDNGQLDSAIRDYSACLALRKNVLEETDRGLADAHTSLAVAHLYNSVPRENSSPVNQVRERKTAAKHYHLAGDIIEQLILKDVRSSVESSELAKRVVAAYDANPTTLNKSIDGDVKEDPGNEKGSSVKGKKMISSSSSSEHDPDLTMSRGTWYESFNVPSKSDTSVADIDKATWDLIDTLQILREKATETLKMASSEAVGQQVSSSTSSASTSFTTTSAPSTASASGQSGASSSSGPSVPGPAGGVTTVGFGAPSGMFGNSGFDAPVLGSAAGSSAGHQLSANTLMPKKKKRKVMLMSTSALPKGGPTPGIGETAAP